MKKSQTAILIALSFLATFLVCLTLRGSGPLLGNTQPSPGPTVEGSLQLLHKLHESFWDDLTNTQKADVVHLIVEIEAAHLGIPVPSLELDQHLLSNNVTDILSAVLTECYGAYQAAQIEVWISLKSHDQSLLLFRRIKQYYEEGDGEDKYALQQLDAQDYANKRAQLYWSRIDNYLFKQEKIRLNLN